MIEVGSGVPKERLEPKVDFCLFSELKGGFLDLFCSLAF